MNRSRITGAILLRWDDCTSIQVQNEQEAKFETLNTHYHVKFSPLQAAVAASILMAVAA